jgi:hypothetical protein
MKKCYICGEEFENSKVFSNHIRWKHKEPTKINCSYCNKQYNKSVITRHETNCIENPLVTAKKSKTCLQCGNHFIDLYKQFCNSSCFASYNNTGRKKDKLTKLKISESVKRKWKEGTYDHLNMSRSPRFTSKNERDIVKYFKNNYPHDEWKSGGGLKIRDNTYISRDLYSDKLQICFEYDGIWHFKDIHGQLEKKKFKDALLADWCRENNYRLIRVDEEDYKNVEQIENLIYQKTDKLILIGSRY